MVAKPFSIGGVLASWFNEGCGQVYGVEGVIYLIVYCAGEEGAGSAIKGIGKFMGASLGG